MSKFGKDLLTSLQQAVDYSKGKKVPGMRVTIIDPEAKFAISNEQYAIKRLLIRLCDAPLKAFPKSREYLDAPKERGVYIIYGPRGTVLHVGCTPRANGGIAQRLRDHMASQSSFTQKYFDGPKNKKGAKLRGTHSYRCLVVKNPRKRALLEALAIGHLCPKHIGHGDR